MTRPLSRAVLVAVVLVALAACTTVNFGTSDGKLRYDPTEPPYTVVGHFQVKVSDPTLINGLLRLSDQDQNSNRFLREQIARFGGTAVRNLNLRYGFGLVDVLLSVITGGIYSPRTITISGDVVK